MSLSAALDSLVSLAKRYEDELREARLEIERLEVENEELRKDQAVVLHENEIMEQPPVFQEKGGIFSFLFADKK